MIKISLLGQVIILHPGQQWHLDLGSYLHVPAVLMEFSVIMFSRQFQWKCFLEQGGNPSAHGWTSVTRYKLVASAHFWVQGDKEQGHKGENASVPSVM